jgi:hypothetical protein
MLLQDLRYGMRKLFVSLRQTKDTPLDGPDTRSSNG